MTASSIFLSRRWMCGPIVILGAALGVAGFSGCAEKAAAPAAGGRRGGGGGPAPVVAGKVERKVMPVALNAIGAVEPIRTASVRSQVTGVLLKLHFQEGQEVKEGDLLFEIDSRTFNTALRQAQADLQKVKVQHETAVAEVARYKGLSEQGMVSKEQYQTIQDNERALQAALGSAEAAVENDRLQVEYCSIRAPISGLTGSVGAHEGDLIRASDTTVSLVTINQLSPIYVTFSVPQQNLGAINHFRAAGTIAVASKPPGLNEVSEKGELTFIDNNIDATTGTLKLKATFPNDDRRLWPGQFASVTVTLDSPTALVVPTSAVQNGQNGQFVFVIKSDQTAEERPVTVERTTEEEAVIASGVREGEIVVAEGQLRVLPGKPVMIKEGPGGTAGETAAANSGKKGKGKPKS
ncbi:MAG TPA: efflux RND transporter periplasmic adaptor subunit [Opitutaceae bacterium]|nr:efflux RND transporter periplasmic adaptor subunit [Opitutaceae bacterium]